ncbi:MULTISPECIES: zinc ribbon domain-containing protein [Metallosphaera]|uniref:zinc ribbon domain-containing protein n=1 Tax=Metallosphaera TaxID=41980 RepID=UPI001F06640F|nr:zinc ribbon domain-containing protein [Metallosphaera sedula]MCH1770129.1 zinc-ribbon domain-containing protein [Metallosphaera sedula]MCP6728037.1 zinc-ribbon domain-containing protein [Metallosphaera sedula]
MQKTIQGVYVNPQQIAYQLENWFRSKKHYQTQVLGMGASYVVQAKKVGFLRTIIGADRAFTVRLVGGQGFLNVDVGLADWLKAADVTEDVIAALVFTPLAVVEGIEELYDLKLEKDIIKEVENLAFSMSQGLGSPMYQPYSQPNPYQYPQQNQPSQYPQPTPYQSQPPNQPSYQPQQKYCPSCGAPNPGTARYCMSCGTQLF